MSSTIKIGSEVRCIRATSSGGALVEGGLYTVVDKTTNNRQVRLKGVIGAFMISRFELVKPKTEAKAKAKPFGQVLSVTVNKSDIHDVLTQYVRFGLGINATVEKIIDKFPEAVELVLAQEAAA